MEIEGVMYHNKLMEENLEKAIQQELQVHLEKYCKGDKTKVKEIFVNIHQFQDGIGGKLDIQVSGIRSVLKNHIWIQNLDKINYYGDK